MQKRSDQRVNMTRLARLALLAILLLAIICPGETVHAQAILDKMIVKDISDDPRIRAAIPRNPEEALLIVKSRIAEMEFESNNKILRINKEDEGIWHIFVVPGTHFITFKAKGYLSEERRMRFPKKSTKGYSVEIEASRRADKAFVHFSSTPENAEVFLEETYLGTTPYQGLIPAGVYTVVVKKPPSYKQVSKRVVLEKGKTNRFSFELPSSYSTLAITSLPSGATVLLNGQRVGSTPYENKQLLPGDYSVMVQSEFYRDGIRSIKLKEGEVVREAITLQPNFGMLLIQAAPDMEVYIDDRFVTKGSLQQRVKPGLHVVEGRRDDAAVYRLEVTVSVNDSIPVHMIQEKQYGRLVLFVEPGDVTSATVYLDGEEIGVAPGVFPNILAGERSLRVSKKGYQPYQTEVQINHNQDTDLKVILQPLPALQDSSQVQAAPPIGVVEEKKSRRWMYYAGGGITIGGVVTYFLIKPSPGNNAPGIPQPTLPGVN